jgi:CBS domain-containing protein
MALDVELAEIRDFLAAHPPFDELPRAVLEALPRRLSVEYFRRGTDIIAHGRDNAALYVLRVGAVDVTDQDGRLVDRCEAGACLGSTTLVGGNPSTFDVLAIEDCLALVMPAEVFAGLCRDHVDFARFFDEQRASRMRAALDAQQMSATGGAILRTHVREMLTREVVAASSTATIGQAARVMAEAGVSSLLVMDGECLAGIVTDRDLRNRVLAAGVDPGEQVTAIMTADPVTASAESLAFEVLLEMVGRNIHHLPVVEGGRPVGVVTTTDLVQLEQSNPIYLVGAIGKQPDVAGVAAVSSRLAAVVGSMVAQDASADDITSVVTAVGDAVDRRLLALAEERLGPPPVPYCWVTLGSRARREQALAADQDNAIILSDDATDEHAAYFRDLAELVVGALAECGYPRCSGGFMATNPRWRRSLARWSDEFASWLGEPTIEGAREASVLLDMRPIHGDVRLFDRLYAQIRRAAPTAVAFLSQLADEAIANEPPLGFFRGFVLERAGAHKDRLDLKHGGIGAVVELARVHGLATGSGALGTLARLDAAIAAEVCTPARGADLRDAFEFISYVRLRHQADQLRAGDPPDSFVAPDDLGSFDKRHLREAFAIIRSAQMQLALRFPRRHIDP